jgi:hypothetical protein
MIVVPSYDQVVKDFLHLKYDIIPFGQSSNRVMEQYTYHKLLLAGLLETHLIYKNSICRKRFDENPVLKNKNVKMSVQRMEHLYYEWE